MIQHKQAQCHAYFYLSLIKAGMSNKNTIYSRARDKIEKQAGTELGQAQLKLELYYTLIFFRFGLIELTGWYINYLDCIN